MYQAEGTYVTGRRKWYITGRRKLGYTRFVGSILYSSESNILDSTESI